jgi:hypothetical protein
MEILRLCILMAVIASTIYIIFKSVEVFVTLILSILRLLKEPEPNRKIKSKNVNSLTEAINEFDLTFYNPILKSDLKSKYREKIKKVHPDHGGKNEDFIRVKEAYDILLSRAI